MRRYRHMNKVEKYPLFRPFFASSNPVVMPLISYFSNVYAKRMVSPGVKNSSEF